MRHTFSGVNNNGTVLVNGSYDINVWYSYDNDSKTAVSTTKYNYQEKMNVAVKESSTITNNSEIIVRSLKQPTVTNATIKDNIVELSIEKELGVEIVGDTKVKISVEEDEDDYEIIPDEINNDDLMSVNEEIEKEVTEGYLE